MYNLSIRVLVGFFVAAVALGYIVYQTTVHFVTLNQISNATTESNAAVQTEPTFIVNDAGQIEVVSTSTDSSQESVSLANADADTSVPDVPPIIPKGSGQREVITLAGGCFWCTEAYLQETAGVVSAISGYAGGRENTANYKAVSAGKTKHREAVQVVFDPALISIEDILEVYWTHIDPTDDDGQFADRGFHYTTAIYYHTDRHRQAAADSKTALQNSGLVDGQIATEILPYTTFFTAEEYHQDYYQKAAAHYERYKKASGRAGFIDDNWAKEAALQFFDEQTEQAKVTFVPTEASPISRDVYQKRVWSESEIQAGLESLPPEAYLVVAKDGTESKDINKYNDFFEDGIYVDVVTGDPLFSSTHKYESGSGWPAFWYPISGSDLILKSDFTLIVPRIEVRSAGGHLGHVFNDGPKEHGGKRYCINSVAMEFVPLNEMVERGYGEWLYLFE